MMNILAFSGLHDDRSLIGKFVNAIEMKNIIPDIIVSAGDIGSSIFEDVLERLSEFHVPILMIGGNWESGLDMGKIASEYPEVHHIASEMYVHDEYSFIGQDAWTDAIADETLEQERYEDLMLKMPKIRSEHHILVTHHPPLGIFDRGSNDPRYIWEDKYGNLHGGSPGIRRYVEDTLPSLHLFAHLHGDGCKWVFSGDTLFSNVSYLSRKTKQGITGRNGSYVMIDTEELTCIPHHLNRMMQQKCSCGSLHFLNYSKCVNCYDDGYGYTSLNDLDDFKIIV